MAGWETGNKLIRNQWAAVCGQPEQKVLAPQSGMEDTEKAEWQVRENTQWVMVRWCQSWWPWEWRRDGSIAKERARRTGREWRRRQSWQMQGRRAAAGGSVPGVSGLVRETHYHLRHPYSSPTHPNPTSPLEPTLKDPKAKFLPRQAAVSMDF